MQILLRVREHASLLPPDTTYTTNTNSNTNTDANANIYTITIATGA